MPVNISLNIDLVKKEYKISISELKLGDASDSTTCWFEF